MTIGAIRPHETCQPKSDMSQVGGQVAHVRPNRTSRPKGMTGQVSTGPGQMWGCCPHPQTVHSWHSVPGSAGGGFLDAGADGVHQKGVPLPPTDDPDSTIHRNRQE